ncbi:MAG: hypothetical protein WCL44_04880 [bacterium]
MKKILRKAGLYTGGTVSRLKPVMSSPAAGPSRTGRTSLQSPSSCRLPPTEGSGNSTMWMIAGVVAIVIVGIVLVAASGGSGGSSRSFSQQRSTSRQGDQASEIGRPDPRLGGKTWAEASRESEKNSRMMQTRKNARMQGSRQ